MTVPEVIIASVLALVGALVTLIWRTQDRAIRDLREELTEMGERMRKTETDAARGEQAYKSLAEDTAELKEGHKQIMRGQMALDSKVERILWKLGQSSSPRDTNKAGG
jgi:predicted  nucleic acid-binding Zn-ribbon protein